jgi:hypothetical protein
MKYQHMMMSGNHVALKMTSSEWLNSEVRERAPAQNRNKVKPEQLKLGNTSPSIWSLIANS